MEKKDTICAECPKRDRCRKPCDKLKKAVGLNGVMERYYKDRIVMYPRRQEVHFSELTENHYIDSGKRYQTAEDFTNEDAIEFSTDDLRLRKTAVFVDRFFNRIPCKVLAEKYGVKENTIVSIYKQAVEQLERMLEVMDARKAGIKAMKPDRFTEDQKFFLLAHVFGFPQAEVARMFNRDRSVVSGKVKRMADRYGEAFKEVCAA